MVLSRNEFGDIIQLARAAGRILASRKQEELNRLSSTDRTKSPHTRVLMILWADGRTHLGQLMKSLIKDPIPDLTVLKDPVKGFELRINGLTQYQEQEVRFAAANEAIGVIRRFLKVFGNVREYLK